MRNDEYAQLAAILAVAQASLMRAATASSVRMAGAHMKSIREQLHAASDMAAVMQRDLDIEEKNP